MKGPIFIMVDGSEAEPAYQGAIFIMLDRTEAETAYEMAHFYHVRHC